MTDFTALALSFGGFEHEAYAISQTTDATIKYTRVTAEGYERHHYDGRTTVIPHGFIPVVDAPYRDEAAPYCVGCGNRRNGGCCMYGGAPAPYELMVCRCQPDPSQLACNCSASSRRNAVHAVACPVAIGIARATVHRGDCALTTADHPDDASTAPFAWRFTTKRECLSAYDTPANEKVWVDRVMFNVLPEYEGPPLSDADVATMGTAVLLDTETTGTSSRDRVIEIACARVEIATGRELDRRATLIHAAGVPIHPDAQRVHGITDAMLRGAPAFRDVWPRVVAFVGNDRVIAHNAAFDRRLLQQCVTADGLQVPSWPWVCSLAWARRAVPEAQSHSLTALREALGVPGGTAHRAYGDVQTLCGVVAKLAERSRGVPDAEVWGAKTKTPLRKAQPQRAQTPTLRLVGGAP